MVYLIPVVIVVLFIFSHNLSPLTNGAVMVFPEFFLNIFTQNFNRKFSALVSGCDISQFLIRWIFNITDSYDNITFFQTG